MPLQQYRVPFQMKRTILIHPNIHSIVGGNAQQIAIGRQGVVMHPQVQVGTGQQVYIRPRKLSVSMKVRLEVQQNLVGHSVDILTR